MPKKPAPKPTPVTGRNTQLEAVADFHLPCASANRRMTEPKGVVWLAIEVCASTLGRLLFVLQLLEFGVEFSSKLIPYFN